MHVTTDCSAVRKPVTIESIVNYTITTQHILDNINVSPRQLLAVSA